MNWFQRYGIVGAYFLTMSFLWLWGIINLELSVELVTIALFSLLPAGYLIAMGAYYLYYHGAFGAPIYEQIYAQMSDEAQEKLQNMFQDDSWKEASVETKLTIIRRMRQQKQFNEPLGHFASRRINVIAMNNSLVLATLAAFIWPVVRGIQIDQAITVHTIVWAFIMSTLSVVIAWVLSSSNEIMEKQIIELHADFDDYVHHQSE